MAPIYKGSPVIVSFITWHIYGFDRNSINYRNEKRAGCLAVCCGSLSIVSGAELAQPPHLIVISRFVLRRGRKNSISRYANPFESFPPVCTEKHGHYDLHV